MRKWEILGFICGIALLILVIYFSNPREVFNAILNSDSRFILLAFLFFTFQTLVKSLRWQAFLSSIKLKVSYSLAFSSFNSAMFLSNVVPFKAFEPIRGYFVKLKQKCSFTKTIPLVIAERAFDVFIYILFSIFALFAIKDLLPPYVALLSIVSLFLFFFLSIAVLLIMNSKKWTSSFFKLLYMFPFLRKFKKKIVEISRKFSLGFRQLKSSRLLPQIIFLTFLTWFLEGVVFFFSAKAVGIELSVPLFLGIPTLSILLGVLTFLPGGIGSTEGIMILILSSLGFQLPQATASVLIYRFYSHLLENSIGAFVLAKSYGLEMISKFAKKFSA